MNPLETAARAIRDARSLPGTKPVARLSDVDRRAALAVLRALHEPSDAMLNTGAQCIDHPDSREQARDVWQDMLAAAIEEGTG